MSPRGVAAVFQEFSLAPDLSVAENLFLGREIRHWGRLCRAEMIARARRLVDQLCFSIDPLAMVGDLTRSRRQMVEIAKAQLEPPRVLILDEPTASLTDHEARRLFDAVVALRKQGVAIIYVSHRLDELRCLSDRTTILRDGRNALTVRTANPLEPNALT